MFENLLKSDDSSISYGDKNVLVCFSSSSDEYYFHIEHISNHSECNVRFGGIIDVYILNDKVIHLSKGSRVALLLKCGKISEMSDEFNSDYFYYGFLNNKELFHYLSADCVYYDTYCSLYYKK